MAPRGAAPPWTVWSSPEERGETAATIEHQRSRQTAAYSESDADPDRSRGPVPDPRRLLLRRGHPGSVGVSARPLVLDRSIALVADVSACTFCSRLAVSGGARAQRRSPTRDSDVQAGAAESVNREVRSVADPLLRQRRVRV
jgi:hypothetical protein